MSPLEIMRERRAAKKQELDELLAGPTAEKRDLTEVESTTFDTLVEEIRKADERINELEEQEKRSAAAAEHRAQTGETGEQRPTAKVTDPEVYARGNGNSYFRDLAKAQLFGDRDAADRLNRHAKATGQEARALGNTNAAGGSGGEFAPPQWLVNEYIALARAGRVTADLLTKHPVPAGVSSISIPRIATGTTVAIQSTQNTALSQTDLTTASVSTGFATVGGKQVVAQQLIDQAAINFDEVVTRDLAAAYAQQIGSQVIVGSGTGSGTNSVINGLSNATVAAANQITYTDASPTAAKLTSKAAGALAAFMTSRFMPPSCWLMHPRRWYWLMAQSDGNQRPLVVPQGAEYNPIATNEGIPAAGRAGLWLGLPVYIDPNMVTNLGTGTNQDRIYLLKQDDLWLFESEPRAEVFRETYADSVGVLFRLYAYAGTILNRYAGGISLAYVDGTGLVAPTF